MSFTNADSGTVVECAYDSMGRRAYKKVIVNGSITLHQQYIYRGYLQIACLDLIRSHHPCLWFITWDPSQPIATRPLAIQINGTWYTYGWDITKNICELYSSTGRIETSYVYSPYGKSTFIGKNIQPLQWGSEFIENEISLLYYNYRYYDSLTAKWTSRDIVKALNLYNYTNQPILKIDVV